MKIADEVPRDDVSTVNTVYFTAELDKLFKENHDTDPTLRLIHLYIYRFLPNCVLFKMCFSKIKA